MKASKSLMNSMTRIDSMCEMHGPYQSFAVKDIDGKEIVSKCPVCMTEQQEKEKAEYKNLQKGIFSDEQKTLTEEQLEKCLLRAGVQQSEVHYRFADFSHEDSPGRLAVKEAYVDIAEGRLLNLLVIGKTGIGKGHLAISAMYRFCQRYYQQYHRSPQLIFTTENKILRSLKASFGRPSLPTEQQVIDKHVNADLLVIDEVGKSNATLYNLVAIEEIINLRHRDKPTIFISNLSEEELKDSLTDGSLSRMSYKAKKFFMSGEKDYRRI